jgi:hypothetical protein
MCLWPAFKVNGFWCHSVMCHRLANGVAPLAMLPRWRTVLKKQQAEKIP